MNTILLLGMISIFQTNETVKYEGVKLGCFDGLKARRAYVINNSHELWTELEHLRIYQNCNGFNEVVIFSKSTLIGINTASGGCKNGYSLRIEKANGKIIVKPKIYRSGACRKTNNGLVWVKIDKIESENIIFEWQ